MRKHIFLFILFLVIGTLAHGKSAVRNWTCEAMGLVSGTLYLNLRQTPSDAIISNLKREQRAVFADSNQELQLDLTPASYERDVLREQRINYGRVMRYKSNNTIAVLTYISEGGMVVVPYHLEVYHNGKRIVNHKLHCWLNE